MGNHPTIVFIDLTGSSAAYEAFDNAMVADMISRITQWAGRVCAAHGGRTVKYLGDGVLAQFPSGVLALSAAIFLQQRYAVELAKLPEGLRMSLKVGMASGAVVQMNADSFGDAVNLAARLCNMAGADAIWADESVLLQDSDGTTEALAQHGVSVLPLAAVRRRHLGMLRIPGLTQARSVFQIFWNPDVPADLLTRPGTLIDLQADPAAAAVRRITLSWLNSRREFDTRTRTILIGRVSSNDIVVSDRRVSRQHARIEWQDGTWVLMDLSSYGTSVRFADDGAGVVLLRRNRCMLHSSGEIALGAPFTDFSAPVLSFQVEAGRIPAAPPPPTSQTQRRLFDTTT